MEQLVQLMLLPGLLQLVWLELRLLQLVWLELRLLQLVWLELRQRRQLGQLWCEQRLMERQGVGMKRRR